MVDSTFKSPDYYKQIIRKFNDNTREPVYKKHISPRVVIGNCSYLYDTLAPATYEDFYYKYITYTNDEPQGYKLRKSQYYGRTVEELEKLAVFWRELCNDNETPIQEYYDALIAHVIVETFEGHAAENYIKNYLIKNGFKIIEPRDVFDLVTADDIDAVSGIDIIAQSPKGRYYYFQIKPMTTFIGNSNTTLINDRIEFFQKQKKWDVNIRKLNHKRPFNEPWPISEIIYMLYDGNHYKKTKEFIWVVNEIENAHYFGKPKFYLSDMVTEEGTIKENAAIHYMKKQLL